MPKKVLVALPPAMLEEIDYIAQLEHRTRSDLIREALRRYTGAAMRERSTNPPIEFPARQKGEVMASGYELPIQQ